MSAVTYIPMGRGERAHRQRQQAAREMTRDAAGISARGDTGQSWPMGKSRSTRDEAVKKSGKTLNARIARDEPQIHRPGRHRANRRR